MAAGRSSQKIRDAVHARYKDRTLVNPVDMGGNRNEKERRTAKFIMIAAPLAGRASLLFFIIFRFSGPMRPAETGWSETMALAWDGMLSGDEYRQYQDKLPRLVPWTRTIARRLARACRFWAI